MMWWNKRKKEGKDASGECSHHALSIAQLSDEAVSRWYGWLGNTPLLSTGLFLNRPPQAKFKAMEPKRCLNCGRLVAYVAETSNVLVDAGRWIMESPFCLTETGELLDAAGPWRRRLPS